MAKQDSRKLVSAGSFEMVMAVTLSRERHSFSKQLNNNG
jgi:hypothetical protein